MIKELGQNPALILLDIMLPDSNGVELIPQIQKFNPNIPIIMLSAQGSIEVAVESLRRGAFDYFPKPLDSSRLEPAIKNAIKKFLICISKLSIYKMKWNKSIVSIVLFLTIQECKLCSNLYPKIFE